MYRYPDENSGLLSWLKSAFGEAEDAYREKVSHEYQGSSLSSMLELLRDYVGEIKSFQYLAHFLDACSSKSMPSKHWVDNLVRPAMLIMMYVRPEGEGDFSLHLHACYEMSYFLAAGV